MEISFYSVCADTPHLPTKDPGQGFEEPSPDRYPTLEDSPAGPGSRCGDRGITRISPREPPPHFNFSSRDWEVAPPPPPHHHQWVRWTLPDPPPAALVRLSSHKWEESCSPPELQSFAAGQLPGKRSCCILTSL